MRVRLRNVQLRITRITDDEDAVKSRNVSPSGPYGLHERFVQPGQGRSVDRHGGQGRSIRRS